MEGERDSLELEFETLLQRLASVGERLQRRTRSPGEIPHYREIEMSAHDMGRRLSQAIQAEASLEIAAQPDEAPCPGCGQRCRLEFQRRTIQSLDGDTEIHEAKGRCRRCQRSFFPSS